MPVAHHYTPWPGLQDDARACPIHPPTREDAPELSRRRKLPPLPEGYFRSFLAVIVCTDAGQHARAKIADLSTAALPGEDPALCWVQYVGGEPVTEWMAADGWRTYEFDCRRCGRHAPLTEPRLIRAVAVLDKSGVSDGRPVLDISWRGLG